MRAHELPSLYFGIAEHVVGVAGADAAIQHELGVADAEYRHTTLDDLAELDIAPDEVIVAVLGPTPPTQLGPDAVQPVLRRLQPGARVVVLSGWPIEDTPYHQILGALSAGHCQVIEAVPLERAQIGGPIHSALIIERVEKLAPPRAYLTDIGTDPTQETWADEAGLEFASVLRAVNECVLVDFVTRPVRQRVFETETAAELRRQLAARDTTIRQLEARLARVEIRLASITSTTTYQVGRALVEGFRHPMRATVTVPRDLARVWRRHRSSRKG
jgi:hypothetical protein